MSRNAIVRADSLFETALGLVLVVGAAAGWLDSDDFPTPVGMPVIVAFGCALLLIGAVIWRLSSKTDARLLRTLASANLATAVAAIAWRLAATGFSTAGSALTLATVIALAVLAITQLRAAVPEYSSALH